MAGLLFLLVLLLHLWLGLWLLTPAVPPQTPVPMVMEVSLVALPGQKAEITPKAPAKPEPPKKQTVKKPVKKKLPVIAKQPAQLKQEALSKAQTSVDQKPTAAPTAPQVVSQQPASVKSEPKISTGVIALQRIPPKYPARAANRHIEGWVKIEFTITTSGGVKDAVVVEAEPAEIFDEAALNAINQWTFQQKIANGVAVEQRAVQTLQFKLTR